MTRPKLQAIFVISAPWVKVAETDY